MRDLAATSMLPSAVGEGLKRIDKATNGELLPLRPEIPWKQVKGMRDTIAQKYFDIDADQIWYTVANELKPLQEAIQYLTQIIQ